MYTALGTLAHCIMLSPLSVSDLQIARIAGWKLKRLNNTSFQPVLRVQVNAFLCKYPKSIQTSRLVSGIHDFESFTFKWNSCVFFFLPSWRKKNPIHCSTIFDLFRFEPFRDRCPLSSIATVFVAKFTKIFRANECFLRCTEANERWRLFHDEYEIRSNILFYTEKKWKILDRNVLYSFKKQKNDKLRGISTNLYEGRISASLFLARKPHHFGAFSPINNKANANSLEFSRKIIHNVRSQCTKSFKQVARQFECGIIEQLKFYHIIWSSVCSRTNEKKEKKKKTKSFWFDVYFSTSF